MTTENPSEVVFAKEDEQNVYSQHGEDGVIRKIVSSLGLEAGTAVEFGALDGISLCNTANLRGHGWKTILIEADAAHADALAKLKDDRTVVLIERVEPEGQHSLDAILDRAGVANVDLLSIDIDGDDLHILAGLRRTPSVICIEFNPAIPPPHAAFNPVGQHKGSSLAAIDQVARTKGYRLIYATYCNAFYVSEGAAIPFRELDVYSAYYLSPRPTVGAFYDGQFCILGSDAQPLRHPWSTVPVYVPAIPSVLRSWPPTLFRVLLSYFYCAVAAPLFYLSALVKEGLAQIKRRV